MKTKIIIFLSVFIFLYACNKENAPDFIQSKGKIVEETRILNPFDSIKIEGNVEIEILQDTCNWVLIKAGKNLLPEIITTVENNTLIIRNKNKFNWVRSYKNKIHLTIGVKKLNRISYDSSEDLTFGNTIVTDTLYFDNNNGAGSISFNINCKYAGFSNHGGVSEMKITGKSDYLHLYTFGYGPTDALDFEVKRCDVHLRNISSAKVNVTEKLHATIESTGNIYYTGNPTSVTTAISGKGQLIKL